jgi:hypothetical protein
VLAAPVVAMLVAGWQLRWMSDDGFIHLRVVEQLVHGNGPVFNAGERVEASTSPLWVALLALAYPVSSLVLPWKAIVLGIALAALGVLAAERAAVSFARASSGARPFLLPLGALVVVALPPFWEFATSGLETGLVFAWLGMCTWACARASSPPASPDSPNSPASALPDADLPPAGLVTPARPFLVLSPWKRAAAAPVGEAPREGAPEIRPARRASWWPGGGDERPAHRRRPRRRGWRHRGTAADVVVVEGDADDPARIVLPAAAAPAAPARGDRRRCPAPRRWRGQLAGGVLVGLGPLIRPDLAVFTAAFGLVLLAAVARRGWRASLAFVGAVAAVPLAYQVFRMGYFAMVVPNTAVAKEAGDSNWEQGRRYLSDLTDPYGLWVPLALLGLVLVVQVGADLRARAWLRTAARLAPVVAGLLHAAYVMRVGGDFMHARLLLPAVFAVAAPIGVTVRRPSWRFGTWTVGPALVGAV